MILLHIGKKVPKELVELPGAIHLGKGIWIFKRKVKEKKK